MDDPNPPEGVTITVELTNNGPFTAIGVEVTDLLPTGVTFVSSTTTQGSYVAGTGIWTVGNMVTSTVNTLVITATVDAGTGGQTVTRGKPSGRAETALTRSRPTPGGGPPLRSDLSPGVPDRLLGRTCIPRGSERIPLNL